MQYENSAVGKPVPRAIDTTTSRFWEENSLPFSTLETIVKQMPKRKETGRPIPVDLSQARIWILYSARKNGFKVPDDLDTGKRKSVTRV